jgi:hypothetical protein
MNKYVSLSFATVSAAPHATSTKLIPKEPKGFLSTLAKLEKLSSFLGLCYCSRLFVCRIDGGGRNELTNLL